MYHLKSIEHRLAWSKALHEMRPQDKNKINQAITKVKSGIMDIVMIVPGNALQRQMLDHINNDARMVNYMTLVESLNNLSDEMLGEVTDLVDDHLKKKYVQQREDQVLSNG